MFTTDSPIWNRNKFLSLNVSHNELIFTIEDTNCINRLTVLDASYNEIRELPSKVCQYVKKMYLGHNRITQISDNFYNGNTSIKELYIEHNQNNTINRTAFANAQKLIKIDLHGNKLMEFQVAIKYLTKLQYLNISMNNISNLQSVALLRSLSW